jgi:hypothetical protein
MSSASEIPEISGKTVALMATFPARLGSLKRAVASLVGQVDAVIVYLNEYEAIPDFLLGSSKIIPVLGAQAMGNLSACGKLYGLRFLTDCYVFTVDDDFEFPANYVAESKKVIDAFGRRVAVCVHGSVFAPETDWYYSRQTIHPWRCALTEHKLVMLPGSGTFAFHQSGFSPEIDLQAKDLMVDLNFAISARRQEIMILSIQRPSEWLRYLGDEGLWDQFVTRRTNHTSEMKRHAPWDLRRYAEIAENVFKRQFGRFDRDIARQMNFDSSVTNAILQGKTGLLRRRTAADYVSRSRHAELALNIQSQAGQK